MNSKQDILNAFREHVRDGEFWEIAEGSVDLFKLEQFILNTLTEFEKEKEKEIFSKLLEAQEKNDISIFLVAIEKPFQRYLSELEKEKRT